MTPAQRRHVQLVGRRRGIGWPLAIMLSIALSLAAMAIAVHEVRELEQFVLSRPSQVDLSDMAMQSNAIHARQREDIDACHRRIDAIDAVIVVIERRRGQEPPRTLAEQRAYRWMPPDMFVPGQGELSE